VKFTMTWEDPAGQYQVARGVPEEEVATEVRRGGCSALRVIVEKDDAARAREMGAALEALRMRRA